MKDYTYATNIELISDLELEMKRKSYLEINDMNFSEYGEDCYNHVLNTVLERMNLPKKVKLKVK